MARWQWGLIQGGLLKICSSRMGACSRGGLIGGGLFEELRYCYSHPQVSSFSLFFIIIIITIQI